MRSIKWIALLLIVGLLQTCRKKDIETTPPQPNDLFTHQVVNQGDGLVRFVADSTQTTAPFTWDFGDGTGPVITPTGKTSHLFTKNTSYQVKLMASSKNQLLTDTRTVTIGTRLARTFNDLPVNQRDTIRVLSVLTHNSFQAQFTDPKDYQYNDYHNQLFINFMKRTLPNRPKEMDGLVFKHIAYTLAPDEITRFNQGGDPVAFLNRLMSTPSDPLYQKLLAKKQKEAVSRMAFLLKDPAPNGVSKYGIGGYAPYEGSYFVLFDTSPELFAHEAGHSFGLAHDTLRDCMYYPLMIGGATKKRGTCGSIWSGLGEFQVSGYENQLVLLETQTSPRYQYAVPDYWRSRFPADRLVKSFTLTYLTTTPYYRTDIDVSKTLSNALITQYNLHLSPGAAISLDQNPALPGGRLGAVKNQPPVRCLL